MRFLNWVLHLVVVTLLFLAAQYLNAQNTDAASDHIVVVGNRAQPVQWNHRETIQDAIRQAQPNGTVVIPSSYTGSDCAPVALCNPGNVVVVDWRNGGGSSGTIALPPGGVFGALCYFTNITLLCDNNATTDGSAHLNAATLNVNAFTVGGTGAGVITFTTGVGINSPAAGKANVWVDSGTGLLSCLLAGAVNCMPGGGGGGTPGGSNTQLQFDDNGSFGGASGLLWNKATSTLTLPGGTTITSLVANATQYLYPSTGQWVVSDNGGGSSTFMTLQGSASGSPSLLMGASDAGATKGSALNLVATSTTYMGHTFSNGVGLLADLGSHHGFAVDGSTGQQYADKLNILGNSGSFFDASLVATANGTKPMSVQPGATATANGALAFDSTANKIHAGINGVDQVVCTTAAEAGCGGGGGSGSGGGAGVSFSAQTSVTIAGSTHKIGTKNLLVQCYDNASPANALQPASYTVNGSTFDVVVAFSASQTGYCVVSGLGPPKYSTTFTTQTTVTVTGATHGLGRADLNVTLWDNASPRNMIQPAAVTVNSSTFDVVATFAAAQTGTIVIQ